MHDEITREVEDLVAKGHFERAARRFLDVTRVISPGLNPDAYASANEIRTEAILLVGEFSELERSKRRYTREAYKVNRNNLIGDMLGLLSRTLDLFDQPDVLLPVLEPVSDVVLPPEAEPEAVNGRSNLHSISWLEQGLTAGRAVVRVIPPKATDADTGIGTGFLLPGGWVITNEHVVSGPEIIARTRIETNFERNVRDELKPTSYYKARAEGAISLGLPWDCTLFRIEDDGSDVPFSDWGYLNLAPKTVPRPGDPLNIIQHPGGGEKKIAVTSNQCIRVNGSKLEYMTDTMKGSSGSPVFDENWQVVGLHRAGGAAEQRPGGRVIYPNEGVAIARLLEHDAFRPVLSEILAHP